MKILDIHLREIDFAAKATRRRLDLSEDLDPASLAALLAAEDTTVVRGKAGRWVSFRNPDGRYLRSRPRGDLIFKLRKPAALEKFFVVPWGVLELLRRAKSGLLYDCLGNEVTDIRLAISDEELFLTVGAASFAITYPSALAFDFQDAQIVIRQGESGLRLRTEPKKPLVYYVVHGRDEFFDMFRMSLETLVKAGRFSGNVLLVSDRDSVALPEGIDPARVKFRKAGHIDLFTRYDLSDPIFDEYGTLIYADADVLFSNPLEPLVLDEQVQAFTAIDERNRQGQAQSVGSVWFGARYMRELEVEFAHNVNSGFFIVHDRAAVTPLFRDIAAKRLLRSHLGDQPFLNVALAKSTFPFRILPVDGPMAFCRSTALLGSDRFKSLTMVHLNSGVGDLSKAGLMKLYYDRILGNRAEESEAAGSADLSGAATGG